MTAYPVKLRLAATLTTPAIRQAMQAAQLPQGGTGLDVGCGLGLHARWLAELTQSKVVGLDKSSIQLDEAMKDTQANPNCDQLEFIKGDLAALPFDDHSFDWVWCADTLWPGVVVDDPFVAVAELARVIRPGGKLALVYWSDQRFLPGHESLEARLGQAFERHAPHLAGVPPAHQFLRAIDWLTAAGLHELKSEVFQAQASAPLSRPMREAIGFCLTMLWEDLKPLLSPEDWQTFRRLCDSTSADHILERPDYACSVNYSLFSGRVA